MSQNQYVRDQLKRFSTTATRKKPTNDNINVTKLFVSHSLKLTSKTEMNTILETFGFSGNKKKELLTRYNEEFLKPMRTKYCGTPFPTKCLKTGKLIYKRSQCKDTQRCQFCQNIRKEKLQKRIEKAKFLTILTQSQAKKIIKQIDKNDYFRLQYHDGENICLFTNEELTLESIPTSQNKEEVESVLLHNSKPTEGFRMSGDLGKEKKQEEETKGEVWTITISAYSFKGLSTPDEQEIIQQAHENTNYPEYSPQSEDEMQEIISEFESELIRLFNKKREFYYSELELSCEMIHFLTIRNTVASNLVNWHDPPDLPI